MPIPKTDLIELVDIDGVENLKTAEINFPFLPYWVIVLYPNYHSINSYISPNQFYRGIF